MTFQVVDFFRHVLFDGAQDAFVEELDFRRSVEEPIHIGGILLDIHISAGQSPSFD